MLDLLQLFVTVAACYLMIAAYAILDNGATPTHGLLWLVYKPFAWLSAQAKSAATSVSATGSAASSSASSFSENEVAALKKLAHDIGADTVAIVRGGAAKSESANVAAAGATESPNPASPPVAASSQQNAGRIPS